MGGGRTQVPPVRARSFAGHAPLAWIPWPAVAVGAGLGAAYWLAESALHAAVFRTGSFAHELLHGGANEMWMRTVTALLFVVLGVVVQRYLGSRRDYEERLHRLAAAVQQSGEAMVITDADGRIQFANPAFTRITGYTLDEVRGRTPAVLRSGTMDDAGYRAVWATIAEGRVWSGSFVDRRKDGRYYPLLLTIAPVVDRGVVTHYVGIQRDMTEQIELEERLRQAEKLEALGTMAGGIAHDFNNALATVTLKLPLALRRARGDAELIEVLGSIERSVDGAAALVRRLMSFARRGSPSAPLAPIELGAWLDQSWPTFDVLMPAPLELRRSNPPHAAWVRADGYALQDVVANLVQNARDVLLERGHGTVTVRVALVPDGGAVSPAAAPLTGSPCAELTVADDGPGVAPGLESKIFEPFFSTKGEHGSGLGLAMARETVHRHGGILWLTSEPSHGATFHVLLPCVAAPAVAVVPPRERTPPRGHGERILLADDQAAFRRTTRALLESLGYRVWEAADGRAAVDLFSSRPDDFELAVLDVHMPRLSGPDAAAEMRAVRPDFPVLLATGWDDGALDGVDLGGRFEVLAKPLRADELGDRLQALVAERHAAAGANADAPPSA